MKLDHLLPLVLSTEKGCQLARGLTALFALLALFSFFSLLGHWWTDLRFPSQQSESVKIQDDLSLSLNDLAERIPEGHLFGYTPPKSDYLPLTAAELRLTGIVHLNSDAASSFSKALVSIEGGSGKVVQVGSMLLDGVKLIDIEADRIIIDNHGHKERLPLHRTRLGEP